jgi:hypothetical protein
LLDLIFQWFALHLLWRSEITIKPEKEATAAVNSRPTFHSIASHRIIALLPIEAGRQQTQTCDDDVKRRLFIVIVLAIAISRSVKKYNRRGTRT